MSNRRLSSVSVPPDDEDSNESNNAEKQVVTTATTLNKATTQPSVVTGSGNVAQNLQPMNNNAAKPRRGRLSEDSGTNTATTTATRRSPPTASRPTRPRSMVVRPAMSLDNLQSNIVDSSQPLVSSLPTSPRSSALRTSKLPASPPLPASCKQQQQQQPVTKPSQNESHDNNKEEYEAKIQYWMMQVEKERAVVSALQRQKEGNT